MKTPLETNSLPPDLAARFAALRATPAPAPSKIPSESEDLEARLRRLEPPTEAQVEKGVPIEVNDQVEDEAVERFLSSLSTPAERPTSSRSPLRSGDRLIPTLSTSALDTLSGIEIEFMKRPTLEGTGSSTTVDNFGGDDEDELMKRMRDELSVEGKENERNEDGMKRWEERMKGLRGVVPSGSTKQKEGEARREKDLGDAPQLGDLERELARRKRKEEKKRKVDKRNTSSESEDSETETESSETDDSLDEDEDDANRSS